MFRQLRSIVESTRGIVRDFEPLTVDGHGAVELVRLFGQLEHLAAAGKAYAAKRVDDTGAFRRSGERSGAHWLATTTGMTVGAAVRAIQTAQALGDLDETDEAFRDGALSETQASEIAAAAQKDPSSQRRLIETAKRGTVKRLKDRCRRVRASAEADDAAWAKRLHDARQLRQWTDADGAPNGMWRMAPDKGAEVKAAIDAETDLIFREARAAGCRDARDAYAADALHALVTRGPRKRTSATLVADEAAIVRGYVKAGERCEIEGIGPIPVTIARTMLADATVRTVTESGSELDHIDTGTRYIPTDLRRWLDTTYPTCGVEGCDADHGLEYDHVVPVSEGGPTTKDNLWRLCRYHHRLKTNERWRVRGEPHRWELVPPAESGPDP
jgi:hypothetical protein